MKNISLWANKNKKSARWLVVVIKITLAFMAFYAGNKLYQQGIHIPIILLGITAMVNICVAILYPSKKLSQISKYTYGKQKSCDFILGACTFIAITTIVSNPIHLKQPLLSSSFASFIKKHPPKAAEIIASLSYRNKNSLSRVEKRVLKKEFYKQLKIYAIAKVTGDKEKANSALPIILTIIVAIGLLMLLAGLVCSLSCSGADVAAGIVAVVGIGGIIWGSVLVINHFKRKSKKNLKAQAPD